MGLGRARLPLLALLALALRAPDPGLTQAPTPPRQVNGILGGSVVLSVDLSPGKNVNKIEWSFRAGPGVTLQLAEFSGGKFERPDPNDRFKQRLEKYNETSLRIRALELGDRGVYEARIRIVPATVEEQAFRLAVYEPVPAPEIESHSLSSPAAGCNVTLQCQVSGREEVNISWSRGNPPRNLGDSKRYQLSPDGRTLHLSLQPNLMDSTFTCTASNPVDQKNISLDLQSICQSGGAAPSPCHWKAIIGALFLGLEINAMVLVNLVHRKMP
ncbi:signaling lymphocytic activation molecule-like [Terrapene carolina triunguis]|uniref:Signaling lymphocytic activation molecule-like n=1 Tax=Terrapene triunguis TaxID=2587831 RepID=A0A674K3C5_9SAUR|nr:signaling lymphocytic activation molecule-like [Terrapene carolina triunguis]